MEILLALHPKSNILINLNALFDTELWYTTQLFKYLNTDILQLILYIFIILQNRKIIDQTCIIIIDINVFVLLTVHEFI